MKFSAFFSHGKCQQCWNKTGIQTIPDFPQLSRWQNVAFEQADSNSLQRIFLIILYALQGCPWLSCHNNLQQRNGEGFKCAVNDVSYSGTPPKEALTPVLVLPSLPFIGMSVWERRNASTCRKVLTSAAYQSLVNSDMKICMSKRHLTKGECKCHRLTSRLSCNSPQSPKTQKFK